MTINNSIKQNLQTETDVEIETSKKKMAIAAGMYVCMIESRTYKTFCVMASNGFYDVITWKFQFFDHF